MKFIQKKLAYLAVSCRKALKKAVGRKILPSLIGLANILRLSLICDSFSTDLALCTKTDKY